MPTATNIMERMNLRRRRAEMLVAAVLNKIDPYIEYEARRDIHRALLEIFFEKGVEVLTDYDRQQMGLPPRGPDGWTAEEIAATERRRLEALTAPVSLTVQTP